MPLTDDDNGVPWSEQLVTTRLAPPLRSDNEYHFPEKHSDAIVRTIAHHREDFDRTVIWFSPQQHAQVRPWIAKPFQRTPETGLGGLLDRLPLEVLHHIMSDMDMHTFFKFRQVNLRLRDTADSLHQYQMVAAHGLNAFCALLRTKLARDVTLSTFYDGLCTKACSFCGEFGGFVKLMTWTRCCFTCFQESGTSLWPLAGLGKRHHLTRAEMRGLRSFKTLPGHYMLEQRLIKGRVTVTPLKEVLRVYDQDPTRPEPLEGPSLSWCLRNLKKFAFMEVAALPYLDQRTGKVERGICCAGCQFAFDQEILSYADPFGKWNTKEKPKDKIYSEDSILRHFKWCKYAQQMWETTAGGARPAEMPATVEREVWGPEYFAEFLGSFAQQPPQHLAFGAGNDAHGNAVS